MGIKLKCHVFEPTVDIKQKPIGVIEPDVEGIVPRLRTIKVSTVEILQGGGQNTSD